jgi:hypothetical protein
MELFNVLSRSCRRVAGTAGKSLADALRFTSEVAMAAFFLWCILFVLCWPIALLALVIYPFVWLLTLPLRIFGIAVHGVLSLISALFFLPVRLLRGPRAS